MALGQPLAQDFSYAGQSVPAAQVAEQLSSNVLPQVLADLEACEPLVVLDAGYGAAETVSFFRDLQRHCRVHFEAWQELLVEEAEREDDERGEETWYRLFSDALGALGEKRFDLLLLWDFFNYLDEPAIRGFNRAMGPYLDERSRGHGFLAPNSNTKLPPRRYSLVVEDGIAFRPAEPFGPQVWQRPHGRLNSLLESMDIGHSVLRHGGLLEFSLKGNR